mmetsp:Transcript_26912/g.55916  ORF Transcript_26912/g.55916 Transcript_26912/m.55916 type:complete len:122 (+) Transcript_26912:234-599(+)
MMLVMNLTLFMQLLPTSSEDDSTHDQARSKYSQEKTTQENRSKTLKEGEWSSVKGKAGTESRTSARTFRKMSPAQKYSNLFAQTWRGPSSNKLLFRNCQTFCLVVCLQSREVESREGVLAM